MEKFTGRVLIPGEAPMSDRERRMFSQLLLVRVALGLNPIHSVVEAVRVLHDDGKEAFEKLRGAKCEHAHEWFPAE